MNRKLLIVGLILIWCFVQASNVMSQTNIQSSDIKAMDSKLDNIMILHLGEIYDTRKTVEGEITFWLSKYKFSASPSNRYFDHQRIPTKDQIAYPEDPLVKMRNLVQHLPIASRKALSLVRFR